MICPRGRASKRTEQRPADRARVATCAPRRSRSEKWVSRLTNTTGSDARLDTRAGRSAQRARTTWARRTAIRRAEARRQALPLRFSARAQWHPEKLSHPQRPVAGSEGQASGGARRGPSRRERIVRRAYPRGALRRRRRHRVGPRRLDSGRRSCGRLPERATEFHPRRREVGRRLAPGAHADGGQAGTVVPDQVRRRRRAALGRDDIVEALPDSVLSERRIPGKLAAKAAAQPGGGRRTGAEPLQSTTSIEGAPGPAAGHLQAAARHPGRRGAGRRMALRDQIRRLSHADADRRGGGPDFHAERP